MMPRDPYEHEDWPNATEELCDMGGCGEPWAWEPDAWNGPRRKVRLCEAHADAWMRGERELAAEREDMAGRIPEPLPMSSLFGLARAQDSRARGGRKRRTG